MCMPKLQVKEKLITREIFSNAIQKLVKTCVFVTHKYQVKFELYHNTMMQNTLTHVTPCIIVHVLYKIKQPTPSDGIHTPALNIHPFCYPLYRNPLNVHSKSCVRCHFSDLKV